MWGTLFKRQQGRTTTPKEHTVDFNKARRITHKATVLLGDAQAVKRGRYTERVTNRVIGRLVSRLLRSVWR